MRTADFQYALPRELIAQAPAAERDASRLLVLHRADGRIEHRRFRDLPQYLRAGDVLVLNDSRVIPARLRGIKRAGGAAIEALLVEECASNDWWAMLRPGKRVRPGTEIDFVPAQPLPAANTAPPLPGRGELPLAAVVREKNNEGHYRLEFRGPADVRDALDSYGEVPLPPYIERKGPPSPTDRARYQTVFARPPGSVAAPTAGLHFTPALLGQLTAAGIDVRFVTLHVGLGTFAPVKAHHLEDHLMHAETFELPSATSRAVNAARAEGRRIVAIGTTVVRVLESAARLELPPRVSEGFSAAPTPDARPTLPPDGWRGKTRLFIRPPWHFRVVDALLTNFHLPESTLLVLVSAFASPGEAHGRDRVLAAYQAAIESRYRFFSYGDAMLLL